MIRRGGMEREEGELQPHLVGQSEAPVFERKAAFTEPLRLGCVGGSLASGS